MCESGDDMERKSGSEVTCVHGVYGCNSKSQI